MKQFCRFLIAAQHSWISFLVLILFCIGSFYIGQRKGDMNLFAASGGVMTIFGLLSTIRFSTVEKYLNQDQIVARSTGMTGPPLSDEDAVRIRKESMERARIRIRKELRAELSGIVFTLLGTLIWAYGGYIPSFLHR